MFKNYCNLTIANIQIKLEFRVKNLCIIQKVYFYGIRRGFYVLKMYF